MELPHCMGWSFTQCNILNSHICDSNLISGRWNSHFMWLAGVIINHNILHTLSNVSVMLRKTFSHSPDEAMSVGLAKVCDLRENLFCWRENQLFHWKSNRMRNLHAYMEIHHFQKVRFSEKPRNWIILVIANIFHVTTISVLSCLWSLKLSLFQGLVFANTFMKVLSDSDR